MKKIYIKNLLRNCIHTYTDSAELALHHCLGSHWCPLQVLCHYGHWCLLQVLCHDGHCCPMLTPYLEPRWSLGSMQTMCLVPCWSLVSTENLHLVTWQSPVYVLQCLDIQIVISLPHTIQGYMYTMSCRHHRMSKFEVINVSMKTTYCHQVACIKKKQVLSTIVL